MAVVAWSISGSEPSVVVVSALAVVDGGEVVADELDVVVDQPPESSLDPPAARCGERDRDACGQERPSAPRHGWNSASVSPASM